MYSGLVLTRFSGRMMGAHQKIDRIARNHLSELLEKPNTFPRIRNILQFEGKNGPDGIKRKSPSRNEPWHFLDPLSADNDLEFTKLIEEHYEQLVKELKSNNIERAGFEAAWLAHTIVDGLTPAHHYPFKEKVNELRSSGSETRNTPMRKLIFEGETKLKTLKNTLKAYGPRGLYMGHALFELGFAWIIRPLRFPDARPSKAEIKRIDSLKPMEYFMQKAREVAVLDLFSEYLKKGWSSKITRQMRQQLAPLIINTVTVIWYKAAKEAGKV